MEKGKINNITDLQLTSIGTTYNPHDRAIRWSNTMLGMLSNEISVVNTRIFTRLTTAYHFIIGCLMFCSLAVNTWQGIINNSQWRELNWILLTVSNLFWHFQAVSCTWTFFFLCHHKSGLPRYYRELEKHTRLHLVMEDRLKSLKFRMVHMGLCLGGWVLGVTPITLQMYFIGKQQYDSFVNLFIKLYIYNE